MGDINDPYGVRCVVPGNGTRKRVRYDADDNVYGKSIYVRPNFRFPRFDLSVVSGATNSVIAYGAVGNGVTDDTAAIQLALNGSSSVYFPPGNYRITFTLLPNSNQHIYGEGIIIGTTGDLMLISGKTKVKVDGLGFKLTLAAPGSYTTFNCLRVINSTFIMINDCIIQHGNGFQSLVCCQFDTGASKCIFANNICSIEDAAYNPATVQNPGLQQHCVFVNGGASNIIIANNTLTNNGTGVGIQAVNFADATDILIIGNDVSEMGHYGMFNYKLNGDTRRITYDGNKIRNVYGSYYNTAVSALSHGAGIYNQSGIVVAITNNMIISTCLLTNNQTLAPGGIGSLLASQYMLISGNTISLSNMYGIIGDGRNVLITGNSIFDCTLTGMYFRDCLYGTVTGNTLEVTGALATLGSRAIFSLGVTPTRFMSITGNTMRNFGISVLLQNSSNFTVSNNVIQCDEAAVATGSGITTDSTCTQGSIMGNIISRNGGFGIRNLGDYINVSGNVTNGTLANQAIVNGATFNNNYGTNVTDTGNLTNASGIVTIASANNIVIPYTMNEGLFINITGTTQINTLLIPLYKRANFIVHIVGPVGLVLANNTAGTGLRLLNASGANITIATANVEVISYRCNGTQFVQF